METQCVDLPETTNVLDVRNTLDIEPSNDPKERKYPKKEMANPIQHITPRARAVVKGGADSDGSDSWTGLDCE